MTDGVSSGATMRSKAVLILVITATAASVVAITSATFSADAARHVATAPKLGHWTALTGSSVVEAGTPAIWENSKHEAYVLWLRNLAPNSFTYEVNKIAANGTAGSPVHIFGHWGSLSNEPTLLDLKGKPLVVFAGIKGTTGKYADGCIYGASGASQPWQLEPWSLSHDCANPVGAAGEDKAGTIAAAWAGGHAVRYHVGTSSSIPASDPDKSISINSSASVYKTGVVANTGGNDDMYVAWAQEFSNPATHDGIYVKNVTSGGSVRKAPGSNTNTINRVGVFSNLAMTARSGHSGLYIAYCAGSSNCKLRLWHVGSSKAMSIHGTSNPGMVNISRGPGGRIWVAWFDESSTNVYVTRSNRAVSRLGRVRHYSTPCSEHGLLGLSSGSSNRLDIALQCLNNKITLKDYVTRVEVGLHVAASQTKVRNTSKHKIIMTVTDTGDPVSGATVTFAGHAGKTNSSGKVAFTLKEHAKTGTYLVTARKSQYASAKTKVKVVA